MFRFTQRHSARWSPAILAVGVALACFPGFGLAQNPTPPTGSAADQPTKDPVPAIKRPSDKYRFDKNRKYLESVIDIKEPAGVDDQRNYLDAYCDLLAHARQFPTQELEQHAVPLPWTTLFGSEGSSYRFDLLKFEGKLMRLIKFDAPQGLVDQGVPTLYEAWIFTENEERPVCLLLTDIPDGLELSKEFKPARPVVAAGYFFRIFTYNSEQKDKKTNQSVVRRAPMLMGHSISVGDAPTNAVSLQNWATGFIPAVLISIALMSALLLGMAWWFRSSDRSAKKVIKKRVETNPFVTPDDAVSSPVRPESAGGSPS